MALSSGSIDAASMASQLVAAERLTPDARLDKVERQITAQVSAVGTLRAALASLRTAVNALSSKASTDARSVSQTSTVNYSATAAAGAATGSYQVEVLALASAQKIASAAYGTELAAVGTGQLTLTAGGKTLNVTIDDTNNSLTGLRDAINAAAAGSTVQASIVTGDDGSHLVLTSLATGVANAVTVTSSGGDGGLAAFDFDPANASATSMAIVAGQAASDAQVRVDGFIKTSATNTVADLVPGVTLNLKLAAVGTTSQMVVSSDPNAQLTVAKNFVQAYNIALASINTTTSYNTTTKVAAALNGDSLVRGTARELRDTVSSNVQELKSLGIVIAKDGTLTITDATFTAAIGKNPDAAAKLFGTGTDSMATKLDVTLDRMVDAGGLLDSRSDSLTSRTKQLATQRTALDTRMAANEARYKAQFTALDVLLTKLQSTSDFLTQQLASSSDS